MNSLLIHLSFLRPIRSLAVIAIYTALAGALARHLLDLDTATSWLVSLNVAFPLLAGFFAVGACHEPLHRSLTLTLPGIRTRQRNTTAIALGAVALIATVGTAWWSHTRVSPFASFGLAFCLSALPCLNEYRRLAGQAGVIAAIAAWFLLCQFAGSALVGVMIELPWLFLIGGLIGGTVAVVAGFSRPRTRSRADTLFIAPQTLTCSYLFHPGMAAGWQAEQLARRNPQQRTMPGQDWNQKVVNTTQGWRAVLWHAQFGASQRSSFLRPHLRTTLVAIVGVLMIASVAYGFSKGSGYWQFVAQCVAPDMAVLRSGGAAGVGGNFAIILPMMAVLEAVMLLSPPITFPISRRRLAQIAFSQALRQWAVALILPAVSLWLLSCLGQILSGKYRSALALTATLGALLPLAALLPWLVATGTIRRPLFRILAALPVGMALMIFTVAHPLQKMALTPAGLAVVALATVGGLALLRHRLHRDYATADLTQNSGFAQFIGLNLNR